MSKSKQVKNTDGGLPAEFSELLVQDAGAGQENMTSEELAIPRLAILQSNSPQVEKRSEQHIDGAESSMIMENVSSELFDGEQGIVVVPISFRRTVIEWRLRENNGGGFVADIGLDFEALKAATKDDKNRLINADGNQLVDTYEYFVFLIDEGECIDWRPAVISMTSSNITTAKRWNTLINQIKVNGPDGSRITPASFYMAYRLTTVPKSNEQGSWFAWSVIKEKPVFKIGNGMDVYLAARDFKSQVDSNSVKVAEPNMAEEEIATEDSPM